MAPPVDDNSVMIGDTYKFDSKVEYLCQDGFRFVDGSARMTIVCVGDGFWRPNITSCESIV